MGNGWSATAYTGFLNGKTQNRIRKLVFVDLHGSVEEHQHAAYEEEAAAGAEGHPDLCQTPSAFTNIDVPDWSQSRVPLRRTEGTGTARVSHTLGV